MDRVFCKLDRVLIGGSWSESFPDAEVRFIAKGNFDHTLMSIRFLQDLQIRKRPFI